jgi:dienelactone hydrolase
MYFSSRNEPVFAISHLPSSIDDGATGVVMCPPFGWEELCTYRTRRVWADACARAGHPAIRFDLPGTSDSAGTPHDPDRLGAWTQAVSDAASWLREEAGCRRIAAVGIGFGGLLAWLASADGAPIDDLLLWAVPSRGRALIRQTRAAALINIDPNIELDGGIMPSREEVFTHPEDDGLLDMGGRLLSEETVTALSELDLTNLPLSNPERRRVLLYEREGVAADRRLREYFESTGAELEVTSGNAYGGMMQYARYAQVPEAEIARSLQWISEAEEAEWRPERGPGQLTTHVESSQTAEFHHDGVTIRETPLTLDVGSERLFAILTEPVDAPMAEVCAVLFNAGSDRRTGPCRAWVEAARRWASQGIPTVRIDEAAIGDSAGDQQYEDLAEYYDPRIIERTIETLDKLEARGLPGRFVLGGFCAGGYWSLHAALADRRVAGVFAINLPFFYWNWWAVNVLHGRWVYRKRRPDDPLIVAAILATLKRLSRLLPPARKLLLRATRWAPNKLDRALDQLRAQGTEVLLMFRPTEPLFDELLGDGRIAELEQMPNMHVDRIPGQDHTFRPLPLQRHVADALDEGLERVRRAGRTTPPPGQACS